MQQYLISIYQPDGPAPPPEVLGPVMQEMGRIRADLQAAGSWVFAGGLHDPGTATVVKLRDGDITMTDGPYVEGKEHVGGFTIVQVADLDAALDVARRYARITTLPIEVRPFRQ